MILVDSSVWIDYFRGVNTRQSDTLDSLLGDEPLAIGDLVLTEVLQGFQQDHAFDRALTMLGTLDLIVVGGPDVAVEADIPASTRLRDYHAQDDRHRDRHPLYRQRIRVAAR